MTQQTDLFAATPTPLPEGLCLLRQQTSLSQWLPSIESLVQHSPWRHWQVPGGGWMSVQSSNAGEVGWCSDRLGYRYEEKDPLTGKAWPSIPTDLQALAADCAARAGYPDFRPDCCLLNLYVPGARMGTHRDADEIDFSQPVVSVSLGLPATFVWLGPQRVGTGHSLRLNDGDVLVFGGPARRGYHRVQTVRARPAGPAYRINLTFRKAR